MAGPLERLLGARLIDIVEALAPGRAVTASAGLSRTRISEGRVVIDMGEITVDDTSGPLDGTIAFQDIHGHATTPDETPEWSSSDESVATVEASEDGTSATITVNGPGAAVIEANWTETDENDNPTEWVSRGTVNVNAGDVQTAEMTFSVRPAEGGGEAPAEESGGEASETEPST